MKLWTRIIAWLKRRSGICCHDGCWNDGEACYFDSGSTRADEFCCRVHAYEQGYCRSCGMFWAGVESFDWNNPSGLCENCRGDSNEFGDYEEDLSMLDP